MPLTLDGTNGVSAVQAGAVESGDLPAGSVIQVVSTTKQDTFSNTDNTQTVLIPDLFVDIAPISTTSKVLILAAVSFSQDDSLNTNLRLLRNGSIITNAQSTTANNNGFMGGNYGATDDRFIVSANINFLDSPSTTSSIRYQIGINQDGDIAPTFINRRGNNNIHGASSHITAMEIAG